MSHRTRQRLLVGLCGLPLLWVAAANGYPLLDFDSGSYIHSGLSLSVPVDRPIFYGLWVLATSLHSSLWGTALAQCVLTSFIVWGVGRLALHQPIHVEAAHPTQFPQIAPHKSPHSAYSLAAHAAAMLALAALSPLPWYAGCVMADIFTPLLGLCAAGLVLAPRALRRGWFWGTVACALMHGSHYVLLAGMALVLTAWLLWAEHRATATNGPTDASPALSPRLAFLFQSKWRVAFAFVVAVLLLSVPNAIKSHVFGPSPASHVFLMGRLAETGLLHPQLARTCAANPNSTPTALCADTAAVPRTLSGFIWNEAMPHAKGWVQAKAQYGPIISAALAHPGNAWRFVRIGLADAGQHLQTVEAGAVPMPQSHNAYKVVHQRLPWEAGMFRASRQQSGQLNGHLHDGLYTVAWWVCLAIATMLLLWLRQPRLRTAIGVLLLCVVGNVLVVGLFIGNDARLGNRADALAVLAAAYGLAAWLPARANAGAHARAHCGTNQRGPARGR